MRSSDLREHGIAGALEESEFDQLLRDVGFEHPSFEPTRFYSAEDAASFLAQSGLDVSAVSAEIDGKFLSAFVRATKPSSAPVACCAPGCCA